MSYQQPGQSEPGLRRRMSRGKGIALWSMGGVVGILVLMFIIGAVAGPAKKDKPSNAAASPSASPTVAAPVTPAATETTAATATTTRPAPKATAPAVTASAKPKARVKPTQTGCGPIRDVIIWMKVPGIPDSAQVVGNWNQATCKDTFDTLPDESPIGPGFCTEAAWVSDNPGYDADATPAKRPKKVQAAVGPAC
ncbi:hypothetical protein ACFZAM_02935 [Streptomyces sp. NPDC008079]|uniref:hypothetical protein n=1 Tax=Streptomyces sp. NPDC008079 TaxID=3364806 RepID=UPI0036ECB171